MGPELLHFFYKPPRHTDTSGLPIVRGETRVWGAEERALVGSIDLISRSWLRLSDCHPPWAAMSVLWAQVSSALSISEGC